LIFIPHGGESSWRIIVTAASGLPRIMEEHESALADEAFLDSLDKFYLGSRLLREAHDLWHARIAD
jgi:hypothetical protein